MKKGGGRRYYRPDDIALLSGIRALLYDDGLSIKKAQVYIKKTGLAAIMARALKPEAQAAAPIEDAAETIDVEAPAETVAAEAAQNVDDGACEPVNAPDDQDNETKAETRERLTSALDRLLKARASLDETLEKH